MKQPLKIIQGGGLSPKSAIEILHEFSKQDAVENSHSEGTQYKYLNIVSNFERYLSATGQPYLTIEEFTMPLLKYFVLWLPENLKSCNRTHISKHVSRINKALDYAVSMGYIPFNPCSSYHVKRGRNKPVVNLEDHEFQLWVNAQWKTKVYQRAQDNYTFQMTTGLSYIDLFNYKTSIDINTGIWIEGTRAKTGKPFAVPLYHKEFEHARLIHEKYNGQLPFIENHFYNRLIREMAAMLGIEKYLTSHIGRKTFINLKDQNGWELGPIGAMTGSTDKVILGHYMNFSKKKIQQEIRRRA